MTNIENESQGSEARSPVIDLQAEDVSPAADTGDTELPEEEPVSPPPPPEKSSSWTTKRIAGMVAIIAALLGAWAYREFGARWWPPSTMSAMEERLGTLEASNHTLNEQLVALSGAFDNFKSGAAQGAEAQANKTSAIEAKLAELNKALGEFRQSVANLGSTPQGPATDPAALTEIKQRIDRLEQQVAALHEAGATPPTTGNEKSAELTQALADLKAKFQAGVAYKDELDHIAVYVPQNADLAELAPFATTGIANAQALGAALDAIVPHLSGPSADGPAPAETSGFWAWVGSVVKVRDLNTLDWADLGKSAAADAKAGDLKAAIARLEAPGGELRPELVDWRDKARQRLKAESAMAQLAAAVTQIIMGKP